MTEDCVDDSDCSGNGICIQEDSTAVPRMGRKCYCKSGYFGKQCQKSSALSIPFNKVQLSDALEFQWRILRDIQEVEVLARSPTKTWLAVGWRPINVNQSCKNFMLEDPYIFGPQEPGGNFHPMDCNDIIVGYAKGIR